MRKLWIGTQVVGAEIVFVTTSEKEARREMAARGSSIRVEWWVQVGWCWVCKEVV